MSISDVHDIFKTKTYLRRVLLVEIQQPGRVLTSHIPLGDESTVVPERDQREGQHQHEGKLQAAPELGARSRDGFPLDLCGAHAPGGGVQAHRKTAALHWFRFILLTTVFLLAILILRRRDTKQWRECLGRWWDCETI